MDSIHPALVSEFLFLPHVPTVMRALRLRRTKAKDSSDPTARSSDRPEVEVSVSAKILAVDDAKVTLELVVPVGVQPGEQIRFKTPVGMCQLGWPRCYYV